MEKLKDDLASEGFICCCKGILVNYVFIDAIKESDIELKNGKTVPMSRRQTSETKKKYLELMQQHSILIM
ncbi:MAG: LytTR family transcriptional regulator DNA-binding domain-containing protein [Bacilli bacterium]